MPTSRSHLVRRVLGEANLHSKTERASLDRALKPGGRDHAETDLGNPEEAREVTLAKQILQAVEKHDFHAIQQAAHELLKMHGAGAGAGGNAA